MVKKSSTRKTRKAKTKPKTKKSSPAKEEHISTPALKLIDQAASLLKKAILKGEEETVHGRQIIRKKALSFLDVANERLTDAVKEGTSLAKKGVRKL